MKREVLFITDSQPHEKHGGASVIALNIVLALRKNFSVNLIFVDNGFDKNFNQIDKTHYNKIYRLNLIKIGFFKKFNPFLKTNLFEGFNLKKKVEDIIKRINPDFIICYGFEAMASCYGINNIKKIAYLGDPLNKPIIARIQFLFNYHFFTQFIEIIKLIFIYLFKFIFFKKHFLNLKEDFDLVLGSSSYHSENDFESEYLQTPIQNQNYYPRKVNNKIFTLTHIGHMKGVVTNDSLNNLVYNIAPTLLKKFNNKNLRIYLLGKYYDNLPNKIKKKIKDYKIFQIVSHVSPISKFLSSVDAVIACNKIKLGVRVRILTCFASKVLVITNSSNSYGIPELKNNYNCFIADDPKTIADVCYKIYKKPIYRKKIENNAYKTFQEKFSIIKFSNFLLNNSH
jgi:glycosyltransferase involved in cell wall biosynthesis